LDNQTDKPFDSIENSDQILLTKNKKQIEILKGKLSMKESALEAMKRTSSQQLDSKIIEILENDIRHIKYEIEVFQAHIRKTEVWCENMGKWKAKVSSARITNPSETSSGSLSSTSNITAMNNATSSSTTSMTTKDSKSSDSSAISNNDNAHILFEIHVQLHEVNHDWNTNNNNNSHRQSLSNLTKNTEGWIIYRTFKQFENLAANLSEISPPEIKDILKKLPNIKRGLLSKTFDETKIKKATLILDSYLDVNTFLFLNN
jgi:hypothetical protein